MPTSAQYYSKVNLQHPVVVERTPISYLVSYSSLLNARSTAIRAAKARRATVGWQIKINMRHPAVAERALKSS